MAGFIILLLVLASVAGSFAGLAIHAGSIPLFEELGKPYTFSIIRFTLWQAFLSAVLSLALAIPLARALHRRRSFFGRTLLIRLTSISLIVPSMVAILGIILIHGRSGWISSLLVATGAGKPEYLYGLAGILIAHVFFNLPLATRLFLNGLSAIPETQWKLSSQFGLQGLNLFRYVEWPVLKGLIPGAAGIVFLLCFTSFAIVLSLGGGPESTTLEVAIYQAVRFSFDLPKAVALSLIQVIICLGLSVLFFSNRSGLNLSAGDAGSGWRPDLDSKSSRVLDSIVILALSTFLLSPFLAIVINSLGGGGWEILGHPGFLQALKFTLLISIISGLLSTFSALALAHLIARVRLHGSLSWAATVPEIVGMLSMLVPPITLGTGLFLLLRETLDIFTMGPVLVILVNVLFTLAFSLRILVSPVSRQMNRFSPLSRSLGIHGFYQWRYVLWPGIRAPACYALAVSTTLSAGDMGVIALFGTEKLSTLPLLIYRLLGSYRFEQAAIVSICLCVLCLLMFLGIERFAKPAGSDQHAVS